MTGQYECPTRPSVSGLTGYLFDGVSVQLVGLPGSGRSELARRVEEELSDADYDTLWVKGIAPLRDRQFAALALAGVPIEPVPASVSSTMVVAKTTDALGKLLGKKRTALVIDDAEHLDPASGGVILAAHARKPFPILFIDRPGRDSDELVNTLVIESQPAVRVAMGSLSFEDIQRLVYEVLPGTVDPAVVARVAILSGGLPRLIRAIVDAARRAGRVQRVNEIWSLTGELWDEHLVHVIYPLLRGLTIEEITALSAVAYAAGSPSGVESVVTSQPAAVLKLREAGLLRVARRSSGCLVSVFPPLLAEYLRGHGPLDVHAIDPSDRGREQRPESGTWRERLPRGIDASEFASRLDSHWQGEVALRKSAWEQHRDDSHAAQLLAAMHAASATPAEIAAVMGRIPLSGDDPAAAASVAAWSAVYRAIAQHDLDGAMAELDEQRALIPDADGYLSAFKAHLAFLNGRALDVAGLLAQAKPHLPVCREAMAGVAVENLIASGRTAQALDFLAGSECHDPMFAGHSRVCEGLARVLGGDVSGGVEWALDHLGDAIDALEPSLIDGHAYTAAVGMALLGGLDDLDDLVDIVFRFPGATTLQRHYRAGLFSLTAIVKGWQGRTEQAQRLAAQAAALSACMGPYPGMLHALKLFLDPTAEAGPLWEIVDERLTNGYLAAATFSAVLAVERGVDKAQAERVIEAGTDSESAVVRALTGYVAAVVAEDEDLLVSAAGELRSVCGPIYAMRALISRAMLLRSRGDVYAAAAQVDAAWRESGSLGARCPGLFARFNAVIDLTPREREVIPLVARGLPSSAIAEEVDVTRRTAETHTLGAYRKIGVRNRRELVDMLETWLVI